MKLARIGDPQLSPDGKMVAFTVRSVDMAANTKPTQIYVVRSNGGTPRQVTREGSQNCRPRWTPDSKTNYVYFKSKQRETDLVDGARWK